MGRPIVYSPATSVVNTTLILSRLEMVPCVRAPISDSQRGSRGGPAAPGPSRGTHALRVVTRPARARGAERCRGRDMTKLQKGGRATFREQRRPGHPGGQTVREGAESVSKDGSNGMTHTHQGGCDIACLVCVDGLQEVGQWPRGDDEVLGRPGLRRLGRERRGAPGPGPGSPHPGPRHAAGRGGGRPWGWLRSMRGRAVPRIEGPGWGDPGDPGGNTPQILDGLCPVTLGGGGEEPPYRSPSACRSPASRAKRTISRRVCRPRLRLGAGEVALHGLGAEKHFLGRLPGRKAIRVHFDRGTLARREHLGPRLVARGAPCFPAREQGRRAAGQIGVPAHDRFDGAHEIGVGDGLVQEARGAGVEGGNEELVLVVNREYQDPRFKSKFGDAGGSLGCRPSRASPDL